MFGGNYNKQEEVSAGARDFSFFALYLYGGVVSKGGSSRNKTGRIRVPGPGGCGSVTRIDGTDGTSLADYRCFRTADDATGPNDFYNYQPFNLLVTPQERGNLFTTINYQINDSVSSFVEVIYNHTNSGFQLASLPFDAVSDDTVISADNFYNPFGIAFGGLSGLTPICRCAWRRSVTARTP